MEATSIAPYFLSFSRFNRTFGAESLILRLIFVRGRPRGPLSVIRYPLFVIRYPLSVIRYSVIRYSLFVIRYSVILKFPNALLNQENTASRWSWTRG